MTLGRIAMAATAVALVSLGCSSSRSNGGSDAAVGDTAPAGDTTASTLPILDELPEGWSIVNTGGDTVCSRGSEYFFLMRKGTTNKVVIDFMGGGACWNDITCSVAKAIFNENLDAFKDLGNQTPGGIYDTENSANPFADWHHVFIPYCTGDVHWGDSVVEYGQGANAFTIHHKGAVNARAVLDWVEDNIVAPETVFVTGCSAGAYGSIGWAPHIIEMYPDAKVSQLGDSGVGIITEKFFKDSFPQWDPWEMLPIWVEGLNLTQEEFFDLSLHDVYGRIGNHYPNHLFTQFTSAFDETQVFYFEAMGGGDENDWSAKMTQSIEEAQKQAANFRSYISAGKKHCILPFDELYSLDTSNVKLIDWVTDIVTGKPVNSVTCTDCK